jgi:hypothetical protein
VNQVEVDVIGAEILEGGFNALSDALVPGVVQFGGEPDLVARHAGVLDTSTDLSLVAVSQSSVNVAVTGEKGVPHGHADLIGLGLPCSKTNGGDLVTGVKGVGLLSVLVRHFDIVRWNNELKKGGPRGKVVFI